MKQLLFLLLFPCLALAQYQGNGNQKITLGEQTTADGLVYRGVANLDTVTATSKITRANKQDTSAYILLDTVTNLLWHYKIGSNVWTQAGGSTLDTATMLLPYWRSGRFSGVLPVANGGTGQTTLTAAGINTGSGTLNYLPKYTATGTTLGNSSIFDNGNVGIRTIPIAFFQVKTATNQNVGLFAGSGGSTISSFNDAVDANVELAFDASVQKFNISGIEKMRITSGGNVGIGEVSPAVQFHTTGGVRFAGLASITDLRTDADGDLFNGSDFNLKNSIDTINFGLSDVLKLKPVSFNWNDEQRNINEYKSMGFIAQDVMNIIPNAASTMGDGDMQVDYNAIVATLTKAIQEQQALIKALEQRILILENK